MQEFRSGLKSIWEASCALTYRRTLEVLFLLPGHGFVLQLLVDVGFIGRGVVHFDQ